MARTRRSTHRRSNVVRKSVSAPRKKVVKVPVDVAAIRAELGDFQKEMVTKINESDVVALVNGTPEKIVANMNQFAKSHGLEPGTFSIGRRSFRSGGRYGYSETRWAIVGSRPFTDAELEKEGPKLVAKKKRKEAADEAKRQKDLAKLNLLAGQLGVKVVTPGKPRVAKASGTRRSATTNGEIKVPDNGLVTRKALIAEAKRLGIKGADRMGKSVIKDAISLRLDKSNL